jgi:hypothetical protein
MQHRNVSPIFLVRALSVETRDIESDEKFERPFQLSIV